jgi:hypothetical protein
MMKIVLTVTGCILLLIPCVVVIGLLLPKAHTVSRAAGYNTTPDKLFTLIAGPQNWRPDVVRYEVVPNSTGRELTQETTRSGETVTYELLDRKPPESIKRRIATPNLPYAGTWSYSLQSHAGGTIVRITENGVVYNPVFRFVSRFIVGHTSTMDAYLRALGRATGQQVQITD